MGGTSGGSTSGKIDYPEYLKTLHYHLINRGDTPSSGSVLVSGNSLMDEINYSLANNPFDSMSVPSVVAASSRLTLAADALQDYDFDSLYTYASREIGDALCYALTPTSDIGTWNTIMAAYYSSIGSPPSAPTLDTTMTTAEEYVPSATLTDSISSLPTLPTTPTIDTTIESASEYVPSATLTDDILSLPTMPTTPTLDTTVDSASEYVPEATLIDDTPSLPTPSGSSNTPNVPAIRTTVIEAEVAAAAAIIDAQISADVLPKLQAGLANIGAAVSSAYSVAQSNLLSNRDRDVAKLSADLYIAAYEALSRESINYEQLLMQESAQDLEVDKIALEKYQLLMSTSQGLNQSKISLEQVKAQAKAAYSSVLAELAKAKAAMNSSQVEVYKAEASAKIDLFNARLANDQGLNRDKLNLEQIKSQARMAYSSSLAELAKAKAAMYSSQAEVYRAESSAEVDLFNARLANNMGLNQEKVKLELAKAQSRSAYITAAATNNQSKASMNSSIVEKYKAEGMLDAQFNELQLKKDSSVVDATLKGISFHHQVNMGSAEAAYHKTSVWLDWQRNVAHYEIEKERIAYLFSKETYDMQNEILENKGRWNLDVFTYAGNLVGSIAGTAVSARGSKPSMAMSALSGALSGVAVAAMIPGVGTMGMVAGGLLGLGSAFL